ncbi:MAG: YbjN domain-containing protein [Rhizobiales bacterium]|nr:YbjN domain-containing protein [Hyphomicrobiales bacterium]MBI3672538.1 YbjN domain-containing protein [Hyphomicrobiales bacterium]
MALNQAFDTDHPNPLDRVERLAERRRWSFDRTNPHEVTMLVEGAWSDLHVAMNWRDELETLHVACTFDAKVPQGRLAETARLVALVNSQLLHGHFDLWLADGSLVFRNSLLLTGGAEANDPQCEALIKLAVETCQRYFPAVQFVVWAGRNAENALASSLFETMGQA